MRIFSLASPARGWWLVLLCAFGCLSCSSSTALNPVKGKVLYKNEPIKGVTVTFHPKGDDGLKTIRPVGFTAEDGSFTLTSGQKEGAASGEYIVTFLCSEEIGGKGGKKAISTAPPDTRDRFQGAFSNAATSKFKAQIKDGPNQLQPFELK
jgi:hypothetical protein